MNLGRMEKLAQTLETQSDINGFGFDMLTVDGGCCRVEDVKCGTAGCVAGWVCILFGDQDTLMDSRDAAQLLGLSPMQANRLFFPNSSYDLYGNDPYSSTPQEAAIAVRKLMKEH